MSFVLTLPGEYFAIRPLTHVTVEYQKYSCCKVILYITLSSYALYLSPKRGFEHVTVYHPEAVAEGRYSVTCSNPSFGGENIMRMNLT